MTGLALSRSVKWIEREARHFLELRYTDSVIVEGANRARFDSRQPVPGALWRPGANVSADPGRLTQPYVVIDGRRTTFSICYENLLLWPHWRLLIERPDVLVSMANDWFAYGLALAEIQNQAIGSVTRLAGTPLLHAENR